VLGSTPGWTEIELGHHPLCPLVVDVQMQCDPSVSIGWMLAMHYFDLLFEGLIFARLPQFTIDVLAVYAQGLRTH